MGSPRRADPVLGGQSRMITFFLGVIFGFAVGYGFGLFIDELDRTIKNDRR
jgi:hypothetical protein